MIWGFILWFNQLETDDIQYDHLQSSPFPPSRPPTPSSSHFISLSYPVKARSLHTFTKTLIERESNLSLTSHITSHLSLVRYDDVIKTHSSAYEQSCSLPFPSIPVYSQKEKIDLEYTSRQLSIKSYGILRLKRYNGKISWRVITKPVGTVSFAVCIYICVCVYVWVVLCLLLLCSVLSWQGNNNQIEKQSKAVTKK